MSLLPVDALLLSSLLFVTPATRPAWRRRLVLHALLLALCLAWAGVRSGASSAGTGLADNPAAILAGIAMSLAAAGLAWRLLPHGPDGPSEPDAPRSAGYAWLVVGLVLVALSLRAVPVQALAPLPHGILCATLAILSTGLLGAVAARGTVGRIGSLLLAGDGLLLAACTLPGPGWPSILCLLLLQAGLLASLLTPILAEPAS